ncbi:MAG: phosphoribosylglycinamide formyltransferase [Zhaonellaceae bacterium]|jgi:phosphoribosylglycinamide formyltransferase-1|nr:phosphoribosylglycinamide formyltransferase [Clostridia bacterium]
MLKVGVLASGRGSNLEALLKQCANKKIAAQVVVVISDKAEAKALAKADEYNVPAFFIDPKVYSSKTEYNRALISKLKNFKVDLVVLAGYMRILDPLFIEAFPGKVINIHPSLLPAFPGLNAQGQALTGGVKYSGCTVHFVDEGMDTGPIIAQAVVPVLPEDTVEVLAQRILAEEHILLPKVVNWIAQGRVKLKGRQVVINI